MKNNLWNVHSMPNQHNRQWNAIFRWFCNIRSEPNPSELNWIEPSRTGTSGRVPVCCQCGGVISGKLWMISFLPFPKLWQIKMDHTKWTLFHSERLAFSFVKCSDSEGKSQFAFSLWPSIPATFVLIKNNAHIKKPVGHIITLSEPPTKRTKTFLLVRSVVVFFPFDRVFWRISLQVQNNDFWALLISNKIC